jgi:hypothetical protein
MQRIEPLKPTDRPSDPRDKELLAAMWRQDLETLYRLAPCRCCCEEHYFDDCAARRWNGCKGQ